MNLNERNNLSMLSTRINQALAALGTELGVAINTGSCSYDPEGNHCTFKLKVSSVNTNGQAMSKEYTDFLRYCDIHGLQKTDLGRPFNFQGDTYEISGYASRSYKRPILAKNRRDGRTYKFSEDTVKRMFAPA